MNILSFFGLMSEKKAKDLIEGAYKKGWHSAKNYKPGSELSHFSRVSRKFGFKIFYLLPRCEGSMENNLRRFFKETGIEQRIAENILTNTKSVDHKALSITLKHLQDKIEDLNALINDTQKSSLEYDDWTSEKESLESQVKTIENVMQI